MCGRYAMTLQAVDRAYKEAAAYFDAEVRRNTKDRFNVPPTAHMPILRVVDGKRVVSLARWKLLPFWSKTPDIKYNTINARMETVATAASYRAPYKHRRCLVPAAGFFEWKTDESGKKQPYFFTVRNMPLVFGGLWDEWKPKDGTKGEPVLSFTIVVGEANPLVNDVNKRMPLILDPKDWDRWLDPAEENPADLLKPFPHERMNVWPVSPAVGNVKNQGPELVEAIGAEVRLAA